MVELLDMLLSQSGKFLQTPYAVIYFGTLLLFTVHLYQMVKWYRLKSRFAPYPTKSFNTSESNNSQSVFKKTLVPQQPQDKAFLLSNV